jgi:hypothetical protein
MLALLLILFFAGESNPHLPSMIDSAIVFLNGYPVLRIK